MKKSESNVFLTSDLLYSHLRGCGRLTFNEMNDLYQLIRDTGIPSESCAASISAELRQTICNIQIFKKKSDSSRLTIRIQPKKQCGIRKDTRCADCIISGKCTDEFVREIIGKRLFAEKYQGK